MPRESPLPGVRYSPHPEESEDAVPDWTGRPDEASAWLASHFRDGLRVLAARRLRDPAAAEDVAQETLRRTLEALRAGRVRDLAALPGFVFETARNICLQRRRSVDREQRALQRLAAAPGAEPANESPDPLTALIDSERVTSMRAAIARLSDDDRELLRLTYVDSLDSEAIGKALGLEGGAVRVRRHRILKRLADWLNVTNAADQERSK